MELVRGFSSNDSKSGAQLLYLLDNQATGIVQTTLNPNSEIGQIRYNASAERLLGLNPDNRGSARWLHLVHPSDHQSLDASRATLLQEGGSYGATIRIIDISTPPQEGETRYKWIKLTTSVAKEDDRVVGLLDIFDDVTEIGKFAYQDALTNLFNRRYLEKSWRENFKRLVKSTGKSAFMGMMIVDVDHLKLVNDTKGPDGGHQAGDKAIMLVSDFLQSQTRGIEDVLARLGGDEFAIFSPEASLATMRKIATRLHTAFNHPEFDRVVAGVTLTLSIGFSSINLLRFTNPDPDPDDLYKLILKRADAALYDAKNQGRNRAVGSDGSIVL